MILIADSGSSKTAWRGVEPEQQMMQWEGQGMNPLHLEDSEIREILSTTFEKDIPRPQAVYFYGAGCVGEETLSRLRSVLSSFFGTDIVEVADDMLAVARGVCGHSPGISCILGTGSNSCLYDGTDIVTKVPALGYVLGDEGSGSWLGKQLIAAYFRNELPAEIREKVSNRFNMERSAVLDKVYRSERPAAYLAGFSKFIFQHKSDPFLYDMIYRGFRLFIELNILKYQNHMELPVHFSGSVAFYYSSILRQACTDSGVTAKNIVEGPVAGLALYHSKA